MTGKSLGHFISFGMTLICALAYLAGYFSGIQSWWWTFFAVPLVYILVLHILQKLK